MKVFISYSHKDTKYKERLAVHLKPLERSTGITVWYDRELYAGDDIENEIDKNLFDSDLFVAIVSPDYLASYYCYEKEMTAALERQAQGVMQIVAVIVEPCLWQSTALKKIKAVPEDGKAVSEWRNENNAYVDVMKEIERLLSRPKAATGLSKEKKEVQPTQHQAFDHTPRYRTKKTFSKIDKLNFVKISFEHIIERLSEWVDEIDRVDGIQAHFEVMDSDRIYVAIVNRDRENRTAEKTVFLKNDSFGFGDIATTDSRTKQSNSMSGGFSVSFDDYELFFKETMSFSRDSSRLSAEDAAAKLWDGLLKQAEVTYA